MTEIFDANAGRVYRREVDCLIEQLEKDVTAISDELRSHHDHKIAYHDLNQTVIYTVLTLKRARRVANPKT